jgi:hypothetical protein
MERSTTWLAVMASMSRKSRSGSSAESAGPAESQVSPPSVVRRTVPLVPETQAILSDTEDRPQNRCLLPVGNSSQASEGSAAGGVAGIAIASAAEPVMVASSLK